MNDNKLFRITFEEMEWPWEGTLDELLEVNDDLPEVVITALRNLGLEDPYKVHLNAVTVFTVERIQ